MKCKWKEYQLKDLAINYDKQRIPLSKMERLQRQGRYRYYGAQGIIDYVDDYIFDGEYLLVAEDGENLKSHKQPIAQVIDGKFWVNNHAHIIQGNELCNTKYLCYAINNLDISGYITGSAQPKLNQVNLNSIRLNIPDREIQDKIVYILESLDSKIINNNYINKNLEEQAKALVKAYFLDFIPYGGEIPKNWQTVSLNDICEKITDGAHYSPTDSPDAPYPMYSVKDMREYGFDPSSCKHITAEEMQKMKQNDCVPQMDDILVAKDGSYLKEIFICSATRDEAILSSVAIFRPNRDMIEPEILLYFLKQPSIRKDVGDNYVSGSALPRIVLKDFKKYPVLLPPMDEQRKISGLLHSYRMKIQSNVDEIYQLQTLRDTLLPRLMSGEIDVSSIEL